MNVSEIKKRVNFLYKKDVDLALKFINNRRFYDLKDLVDSSIIIHQKDSLKSSPRTETLAINRMDMMELKDYVDAYLMSIDPSYFDDLDDLYEDTDLYNEEEEDDLW